MEWKLSDLWSEGGVQRKIRLRLDSGVKRGAKTGRMGKVFLRKLERKVECKQKWTLESSWRGFAMGFPSPLTRFVLVLLHATSSLASFRWPRLAPQVECMVTRLLAPGKNREPSDPSLWMCLDGKNTSPPSRGCGLVSVGVGWWEIQKGEGLLSGKLGFCRTGMTEVSRTEKDHLTDVSISIGSVNNS